MTNLHVISNLHDFLSSVKHKITISAGLKQCHALVPVIGYWSVFRICILILIIKYCKVHYFCCNYLSNRHRFLRMTHIYSQTEVCNWEQAVLYRGLIAQISTQLSNILEYGDVVFPAVIPKLRGWKLLLQDTGGTYMTIAQRLTLNLPCYAEKFKHSVWYC